MANRALVAGVLLLLSGSALGAQDADVEYRVGVGLGVASMSRMESGPALSGSVTLMPPNSVIGLRLGAGAALMNLLGTELVLDASASAEIQKRSGSVRPFVYAGVGYYRIPTYSRREPWRNDLGVNGGLGVAWTWYGREWYADAGMRFFGNVFYGRATRSFMPISFGVVL